MILLLLCLGLFRPSVASVNMTADAAASCDPDYGWINGPEGSNKCYMVLRDQAFASCFPNGGGGYPSVCDPNNPYCYNECSDVTCCYDYHCSGGSYYSSFTWFEAQQCCVANHGFLAEPSSQEEHDLIKERLTIMDGGAFVSYWLGGVDYFEEGVWQWSNGDPWSYENWHAGEPNNVDNEDCLSMSSQDSYEWMDLGCGTRDHGGVSHYAVCENRKG